MDLRTVKEELLGGNYTSAPDFVKDMRLIFTNSRNYNTNKRSRVSKIFWFVSYNVFMPLLFPTIHEIFFFCVSSKITLCSTKSHACLVREENRTNNPSSEYKQNFVNIETLSLNTMGRCYLSQFSFFCVHAFLFIQNHLQDNLVRRFSKIKMLYY